MNSILCIQHCHQTKCFQIYSAAKDTYQFATQADSYGRMFSLLPWIAKLFPNLSGYNTIKQATSAQFDFMKSLVDEQYQSYDESHQRHFLDVYFKEMKAKQRNKNFQHTDFVCTKMKHSRCAHTPTKFLTFQTIS